MDIHPLDDAAGQSKPRLEAELSHPQGLSKKGQKRARKAAMLHELRLERRAREKEAKKRRRRERANASQLDEDTPRIRRANTGGETEIFNARVVIDLGFDELMSDKEINSLTSQLAYTYSANRYATHAFPVLIFTSLNGRTKERLDSMNDAGYKRWSSTEWWEEGYDRLWTEFSQAPSEEGSARDGLALPQADRKDIVYLTADSDQELLELTEGELYIIGGICDHNRYKNLCLKKAINSQIRHARLPIGRYISLATRKVLTVNQVFQILLKWVEFRDWEEAFWAVIPKRKLEGGSRGRQGKDGIAQLDDDGKRGPNIDDDGEIRSSDRGTSDLLGVDIEKSRQLIL